MAESPLLQCTRTSSTPEKDDWICAIVPTSIRSLTGTGSEAQWDAREKPCRALKKMSNAASPVSSALESAAEGVASSAASLPTLAMSEAGINTETEDVSFYVSPTPAAAFWRAPLRRRGPDPIERRPSWRCIKANHCNSALFRDQTMA